MHIIHCRSIHILSIDCREIWVARRLIYLSEWLELKRMNVLLRDGLIIIIEGEIDTLEGSSLNEVFFIILTLVY